MASNNYNRERAWGDLFREHGEDLVPVREETGEGFSELFARKGMKGYVPKAVDQLPTDLPPLRRYPAEPQDVLDLHGLTMEQAERAILPFIRGCRERRLVYVRIITGKGINSEGGTSKLRPLTLRVLQHMISEQLIRNFSSAEPRHGGFGAIYVYIK